MTTASSCNSSWQIFWIFLRLGLTSFGGPIAHLAYFRQAFVVKRHWLSEQAYSSLVALCQFLPGPVSSQVGMAIGLQQAGWRGMLAAWLGFTLPSALLLLAAAYALPVLAYDKLPQLLHALKLVAVAVVAQALLQMARNLCRGTVRFMLMLAVAGLMLWQHTAGFQAVAILLCALAGKLWLQAEPSAVENSTATSAVSYKVAFLALAAFVILLLGLPVASYLSQTPTLQLADIFYRSGALVFGGGHVVLPLLHADLVQPGYISADQFIAGYAAAQAVPGPLFTFAAFAGASSDLLPGFYGALIALLSIFLPAALVLLAVLPHWQRLQQYAPVRAALSGVGAGVTGLLLATFITPLASSSLLTLTDIALATLGFLLLQYARISPLLLVILAIVSSVLW